MYRLSAWKVNWILLFIDVMYLPPHSNQTFPQCPSSAPPELSITGRWRVGVEYRIKYNFERHLTIVISSFFIHDSRDFLGKGKKGYRKIKDKASETCGFFSWIGNQNDEGLSHGSAELTSYEQQNVWNFDLPFDWTSNSWTECSFPISPFPVRPETKILGCHKCYPNTNPPNSSSIPPRCGRHDPAKVRHNLRSTELTPSEMT